MNTVNATPGGHRIPPPLPADTPLAQIRLYYVRVSCLLVAPERVTHIDGHGLRI